MKKYRSFQLFICQVGFYLSQNRYAVMYPGISFRLLGPSGRCCFSVLCCFLTVLFYCFFLLPNFFSILLIKKKKTLKYKYCPVSEKTKYFERLCLLTILTKDLMFGKWKELLHTETTVFVWREVAGDFRICYKVQGFCLCLQANIDLSLLAIASYRLRVMYELQFCPHPSLNISLDVRVRIESGSS